MLSVCLSLSVSPSLCLPPTRSKQTPSSTQCQLWSVVVVDSAVRQWTVRWGRSLASGRAVSFPLKKLVPDSSVRPLCCVRVTLSVGCRHEETDRRRRKLREANSQSVLPCDASGVTWLSDSPSDSVCLLRLQRLGHNSQLRRWRSVLGDVPVSESTWTCLIKPGRKIRLDVLLFLN